MNARRPLSLQCSCWHLKPRICTNLPSPRPSGEYPAVPEPDVCRAAHGQTTSTQPPPSLTTSPAATSQSSKGSMLSIALAPPTAADTERSLTTTASMSTPNASASPSSVQHKSGDHSVMTERNSPRPPFKLADPGTRTTRYEPPAPASPQPFWWIASSRAS